MKKSIFKFILANIFIFSLVAIALAYYMVGVVDRASVRTLVEKRFSTLEKAIDDSNMEIETILSQIGEETVVKAKAFAIVLNQSPRIYIDNEALEEIRVALSADEIIITDKNGIVIAGTSPYIGQNLMDSEIKDYFTAENFTEGNFSTTVNIQKNGKISQFAGVSRLDDKGIIVIESVNKYLLQTIKLAGISSATSGFSLFKKDHASIINKSSWQYVSHTNDEFIGQGVQIPQTYFKNLDTTGTGRFKLKIQGVSSFVYYKAYKDNIITVDIDLKEVYFRRNYVVVSLLIVLPIFALIVVLALRKKLIDIHLE